MVEARPFAAHEPRVQVDFLEDAVGDSPVLGPADTGQVAVDRVQHRQQGRVVGGVDVEVVEVRFVAVAAVDARDLVVGAVHDDLFALTESLRRDVALPPGQHRACLRTAAPGGWLPRSPAGPAGTTRAGRCCRRSSGHPGRDPNRAPQRCTRGIPACFSLVTWIAGGCRLGSEWKCWTSLAVPVGCLPGCE